MIRYAQKCQLSIQFSKYCLKSKPCYLVFFVDPVKAYCLTQYQKFDQGSATTLRQALENMQENSRKLHFSGRSTTLVAVSIARQHEDHSILHLKQENDSFSTTLILKCTTVYIIPVHFSCAAEAHIYDANPLAIILVPVFISYTNLMI